jgi:excisionase family DNA binding protein
MVDGFSLDTVIEAFASAVAVKLRNQAGDNGAEPIRPRLLSVEQAAVYLGRTKPAIQHMIADGSLRPVRSDRRVFLDKQDLDKWIEQNKG